MKGIDLTNYALEDLLAFDDIFLDYFNSFLKNSAFPQLIQYNRYLGKFEEIDQTPNSIVVTDRLPKHIHLGEANQNNSNNQSHSSDRSESEQNRIFDWVRNERLPLFFRTDFFREFKLCKLLTRSLDGERPNSATSSQLIGGYSRQSPPISNSLSTEDQEGRTTVGAAILFGSASNNNLDDPDEIESSNKLTNNDFEDIIKGLYNDNEIEIESGNLQADIPYLERFNRALFQRPGSRALSVPSYFPFASINRYASSNLLTKANQIKKRSEISKSGFKSSTLNEMENKSNLKRQDKIEDLAKLDISKISERNEIEVPKQKHLLPADQQHPPSELNASFYNDVQTEDYYEAELGNYESINDENNMLTKLNDNLSYVEDDEDNDDYAENVLHASINQYKIKFLGSVNGMKELKEFLKNTIGARLLKFWLDCEFYRDSMQDYDQIDNMATRNRLFRHINEKYVFSFATKMHQKISKCYQNGQGLNHTLFDRIQYDILRRLRAYWVPRFVISNLKHKGKDYGSFPLPPLTPDYSRQSTYLSAPSTIKMIPFTSHDTRQDYLSERQKNVLYSKVKQALLVDKEAGGPFLRYISANCPENLPLILFWYDVCDFNNADSIGYDKNSRLQHAWAIYNSYLASTARFNIGISNEVSEQARKSLQMQSNLGANFKNDIDIDLFQPVMEQIVPYLENAWIQFIKDDVSKYTKARLAFLNRTNDEDTDEEDGDEKTMNDNLTRPELIIENGQVYLRRQMVLDMLLNRDKVKQDVKKRVLTEEERLERAERIRQIEYERKKALRAAAKRAKMNKLSALEEEKTDEQKNGEEKEKRLAKKGANFATDRTALFEKLFANKNLIQLFRKYFFDNNFKDVLNKFNVYVEAKQFIESSDQQKKNNISNLILKQFLDPNSKRNILPLNDRLQQKLKNDATSDTRGPIRPKTGFIIGLLKEFRPLLEEHFQKFCEQQAHDHNLASAEEFALLNQTELLVLLGDNYNPKEFDFDDEKGEGKGLPTREDRAEFSKMLYEWSIGKNSDKLYAFYAHLTEHGKKDGLPFLEKDLLFCIDSIRIKEINGEENIKQKSLIMIDVYLDSQTPPPIQLDVNHETHQKLLKSALKITQGNYTSTDLGIFDEVRAQMFKDLVPYWAGFKHNYREDNQYPMTKQEKMLKERLEEFLNIRNPSPNDFKLPPLSPTPPGTPTNSVNKTETHKPANLNIVFSIATGIKYKDDKALISNAAANGGRNSVTTSNERRNSNAIPIYTR